MTYDSSSLTSVRPVESLVCVLTADGTPYQSLVEAFLVLPRFIFFLLYMFLNLTCNSFLVVRLLTLIVASLSTLIHVLFKIVALTRCLVLAPDAMMASRSLTGFVFPMLRPPPVSRPLLPPLLALFNSGIIVLDIYVVLASHLVHRGVLGSVSVNASLDCLGCRLGKQIYLPYPLCPSVLSISFTLMFGVRLPSRRKGAITIMLSL
jgi:hypothetical protein